MTFRNSIPFRGPLARRLLGGGRVAAEIDLTFRLVDLPSDLPGTDVPAGSLGRSPLTRVLAAQLIGRSLTRDDMVSARLVGKNVIELCILDRAAHCARNQARMQFGRACHEYARWLLGVSIWRYRTDPASRAEVRRLRQIVALPGDGAEPHSGQGQPPLAQPLQGRQASRPPVHRDGTDNRGA